MTGKFWMFAFDNKGIVCLFLLPCSTWQIGYPSLTGRTSFTLPHKRVKIDLETY